MIFIKTDQEATASDYLLRRFPSFRD